MKIGFIGTGQITKAVVTGVINSKLKITKIFLSERNKKISRILKFKSKKIKIIKKNQDIINKSELVQRFVDASIDGYISSLLKPYFLYLSKFRREILAISKNNFCLYLFTSPFTETKSPSLKEQS